jgi:hypothetical protein
MARLSQFDTVESANAGMEVELKDIKTSKPSGFFIKILGTDSEVYQDLKYQRSREAALRPDGYVQSPEEYRALTIDTLSSCTVGWRGLIGEDEKEIPHTKQGARDLYARFPAIRDQINVAIADRANFVKT